MFELSGKYTSAKIFQEKDKVEKACIDQIQTLIDFPAYEGCNICIMPDCHAGASCPIGTTIALKKRVIPETVSVDIGCGMLVINLGKLNIDFGTLDRIIKTSVPSGLNVYNHPTSTLDFTKLYCYKGLKNLDHLAASMGTLGGGNHFIEVDKDDEDNIYLVIHSGSRNLGKQVCEYYQSLANEVVNKKLEEFNKEKNELIDGYKNAGMRYEIPRAIEDLKEKYSKLNPEVPYEMAYLEEENFDKYIHDMVICQEFAKLNREMIAKTILDLYPVKFYWEDLEKFETIHNYIDTSSMILRKGSVAAGQGQKLIIPINMRDGSLICKGLGDVNMNVSAPHGAGRLMSRSKARKDISMEDFKESMKGIYSSCICEETLDESPMAYKSLEDILPNIRTTVEVVKRIKPVYNFKGTN